MNTLLLVLIATSFGAVQAQSYAGCHVRDGIEYCPGNGDGDVRVAVQAPTITPHLPRDVVARATSSSQGAAVTGCHNHGSDVYCIDGEGHEVSVSLASTSTGELPAQYTGCHSHGDERYVVLSLRVIVDY